MRATDILTIGDINVDLILNGMKSLPVLAKEILSESMELTIGGSSTIFAINASSLGSKVAFMGMVGDDPYGRFMTEGLTSRGVNVDRVMRSSEHATGATIVLNYDEERANVTYQGTMAVFSLDDVDRKAFEEAKHLHVSSIFMQPGLLPHATRLFKEAKNAGMTTSLDPQWDPAEKWNLDLEELLPHVDVFLPNEIEFSKLTGGVATEEALGRLSPYANMVVVKRGSRGSLLWNRGSVVELEAFKNEAVVDAIGAGDSFDAGFIHLYVKGALPVECQCLGNLTGAVSTTGSGGTSAIKDYDSVIAMGRERFGYDTEEV